VGKCSSGIGICNKCNEKGLQPMPVTCVGCATILADLENGRQIESNASGCESNVFIW